jgi:enamine deaminase RidA (YjgF/YER057c/UK114 family)
MVTKANGFVFVSGTPPFDLTTGKLVRGDIEVQTEACLRGVQHCLESAGSSLEKAVMEWTEARVALARERQVRFGRPPKLTDAMVRQIMLAHDNPATTVPETCRVLKISRSSYYAALRAGRQLSEVAA